MLLFLALASVMLGGVTRVSSFWVEQILARFRDRGEPIPSINESADQIDYS